MKGKSDSEINDLYRTTLETKIDSARQHLVGVRLKLDGGVRANIDRDAFKFDESESISNDRLVRSGATGMEKSLQGITDLGTRLNLFITNPAEYRRTEPTPDSCCVVL